MREEMQERSWVFAEQKKIMKLKNLNNVEWFNKTRYKPSK